jgi:predicted SprT family Zn-dependent metalloprotease
MRNSDGDRYADCVLLHVLLHEVAHVLNQQGIGHGAKFRRILRHLETQPRPTNTTQCPENVPNDYNAQCQRSGSTHEAAVST